MLGEWIMDKSKILEIIDTARSDKEVRIKLSELLVDIFDLRKNPFHPLAFINGEPELGNNIYIGLFSEINARGGRIVIGDNCDIASFVSINVADSHKLTIELSEAIDRSTIILENHVFVGSHSFIGGDTFIGHHTVVAAGTVLINGGKIPPFSLIVGNPARIKSGYYTDAHITA
jgi:acetyltransferase-like isoleucine patch superfamily enzyme